MWIKNIFYYKFYQNLADLNEIKVEQLLNNESSKFIKDIKEKNCDKNEKKYDIFVLD